MFCMDQEQTHQKFKEYLLPFPERSRELEEQVAQCDEEIRWLFYQAVLQLPITDLIAMDAVMLTRHVKSIYQALREMAYAREIPQEIVIRYVLPFRVNDEAFLLYSEKFYQELQGKLQGKTIEQAALEVNYCSLGKATYAQADDRTQSAIATERVGKGRCGEESVLLVSMLRSVAIPARQVYSPYWLHCDDNHAWVEIWTPEGWKFMGACEPEETLCHGWFNHAASRASIVRHRVFGVAAPHGSTEGNQIFTTEYTTSLYGKTREVQISVVENGQPLPHIVVGIYTVNYNMPKLLMQGITDAQGNLSVTLGRGDVMLFAMDKEKHGIRVCKEEETAVILEITSVRSHCSFALQPSKGDIWGEQFQISEKHTQRLEQETQYRMQRHKKEFSGEYGDYLAQAGENQQEILQFLENPCFTEKEKLNVLETLSHKDFSDVTSAVLVDMAEFQQRMQLDDRDFTCLYLLALRVKNEHLYPQRTVIQSFCHQHHIQTPQDVYAFLKGCRCMDDYDFGELVGDVRSVLRYGVVTSSSLPIHFVQICRALGIPARLCPYYGVAEYWQGESFISVESETSTGSLMLKLPQNVRPTHQSDVTISIWTGKDFTHLPLIGESHGDCSYAVKEGFYAITHSSRQIDGSVLGEIHLCSVKSGEEVSVELSPICDQTKQKLMHHSLPQGFPIFEGNVIYGCIDSGCEPTEHFLNELLEQEEQIVKQGVQICLLSTERRGNALLERVKEKPWVTLLPFPMNEDLCAFRAKMEIGDLRLPFITAVQEQKARYSFANYNVGTVTLLLKILRESQ